MTVSWDVFPIKIDPYFDVYPTENINPKAIFYYFTSYFGNNRSPNFDISEMRKGNENTFTGKDSFIRSIPKNVGIFLPEKIFFSFKDTLMISSETTNNSSKMYKHTWKCVIKKSQTVSKFQSVGDK